MFNKTLYKKQTSTTCDEESVTSTAAVHWCILNKNQHYNINNQFVQLCNFYEVEII